MQKISIAIDGHSSTGKSTVARQLAESLGYVYIDSGAMYRAVTLFALQRGLIGESPDRDGLIRELGGLTLAFAVDPETGSSQIELNGENVEGKIRTLEVS